MLNISLSTTEKYYKLWIENTAEVTGICTQIRRVSIEVFEAFVFQSI